MMRQRWLPMLGVIVIAALLAFPLRAVVNQVVLVPVAYLLFLLKLLYVSLDQVVWWIAAVFVVRHSRRAGLHATCPSTVGFAKTAHSSAQGGDE